MAIRPSIPLQAQVANPNPGIAQLANLIQQGKQNQVQQERTQLARNADARQAEISDLQKQQMLMNIDRAGKTKSALEHAEFTIALQSALLANDVGLAKNIALDHKSKLGDRISAGENVSTIHTDNYISLLDSDPAAALQVASQEIDGFTRLGIVKQLTNKNGSTINKAFAPVVIKNETTGEKRLVSPTVRDGVATLSEFDVPEGFQISLETPEEKRAAEVLANLEKVSNKLEAELEKKPEIESAVSAAKGRVERDDELVAKGLEAADGIAGLRQGISLLDRVETGGLRAVAQRAKALFGIETADEGELSNQLSKAVLSQLRDTFGAAFTEREGARLERIEAGFTKSTETNKRLLNRALGIARRAAERGIRAAERLGDEDTVEEIRAAMEQVLEAEPEKGDSELSPEEQKELERLLKLESEGKI